MRFFNIIVAASLIAVVSGRRGMPETKPPHKITPGVGWNLPSDDNKDKMSKVKEVKNVKGT